MAKLCLIWEGQCDALFYFYKFIRFLTYGDKLYYTSGTKLYEVDCEDTSNTKSYELDFYAGGLKYNDGLLYIENRAGSKIGITLFSIDSGEELTTLRGKYGSLNNFAINPVEQEVVGAWSDGSISVWKNIVLDKAAENEIYKYIDNPNSSMTARFKFSEDGKYLTKFKY